MTRVIGTIRNNKLTIGYLEKLEFSFKIEA